MAAPFAGLIREAPNGPYEFEDYKIFYALWPAPTSTVGLTTTSPLSKVCPTGFFGGTTTCRGSSRLEFSFVADLLSDARFLNQTTLVNEPFSLRAAQTPAPAYVTVAYEVEASAQSGFDNGACPVGGGCGTRVPFTLTITTTLGAIVDVVSSVSPAGGTGAGIDTNVRHLELGSAAYTGAPTNPDANWLIPYATFLADPVATVLIVADPAYSLNIREVRFIMTPWYTIVPGDTTDPLVPGEVAVLAAPGGVVHYK
jgi:hypothetical protein